MKNRKSTTTFASYRLFMLLKILFENKATVKDIVVYLEKIDPTNKTYSDITVYKYLNSLRSMDFDLVRDEQNRYTITKLPYTFKFPKEVLSVLKSINDYTSFIEETTVKNNLSNFISMIKKRLNDEDVDYFEHVNTENITTERVYTQKELELIKNFERNVKENFKICISYKEDKSTVKRLIVSPVSIEYKENKVYEMRYPHHRKYDAGNPYPFPRHKEDAQSHKNRNCRQYPCFGLRQHSLFLNKGFQVLFI